MKNSNENYLLSKKDSEKYSGASVLMLDSNNKVVGSGKTYEEAYKEATGNGCKNEDLIAFYVTKHNKNLFRYSIAA